MRVEITRKSPISGFPLKHLWYMLIGTLACFVAWTALAFYWPALRSVDEYLYALASKGASCPPWISLNRKLSFLGYGTSLYIMGGLLLLYLVKRRNYKEAVFLIAAFFLGKWSNWTLKMLLEKPRPMAFEGHLMLKSYAYPSGHAFISVFFYSAVVWVLQELRALPVTWRWLKWFVCLLVMSVGMSRLALGVHWMSDVIGGFLSGIAWLLLNIVLARHLGLFGERSLTSAPKHRPRRYAKESRNG